jgi:LysM repeat protein
MGERTIFPLRWNNPHASECEINIWIKSMNNDVVVPIKKPSCCGEGYQNNVIDFIVPKDFNQLPLKVPGFNGCNKIGDCTLQLYAHSVEPRTYAIGVPILITNSSLPVNNVVPRIEPATIDPQLNLTILQRDVCLPTTSEQSHKISAIPRYARLVSDQFNHAYQNSDYSPYSGQQHELISRNLQSASILRMTAANGGELGNSILNDDDKKYINTLISNVNKIVQKYEVAANNVFNKIKNQYQIPASLGQQKLATCFRCADTGSVNPERIEQQTYIPSFTIDNVDTANQIRSNLPNNVKNLIPVNSQNVQIYNAALNEVKDEFVNAAVKGFVYQPAMLKTTITTMNDPTNFRKVDETGKKDDGVYASNIASTVKSQNINKITNLFSLKYNPTPSITSLPTTTRTLTDIDITDSETLPQNPDDENQVEICDLDESIINCSKPCTSSQSIKCTVLCSSVNNICNNKKLTNNSFRQKPMTLLLIIFFIISFM